MKRKLWFKERWWAIRPILFLVPCFAVLELSVNYWFKLIATVVLLPLLSLILDYFTEGIPSASTIILAFGAAMLWFHRTGANLPVTLLFSLCIVCMIVSYSQEAVHRKRSINQ